MNCTGCGAPIESGCGFCSNCGRQHAPTNNPQMGRPAPGGYQQKSKIVAGLLGIFLGAYGVHNFYLGFTGKAVTQLLLSIIGYITVWFFIGIIPLMIASIWGLVEGIMILCTANGVDAHGVPLAD